jgi:hypothetical protein
VKDYNGDMQRPEPFGHRILLITGSTQVWKSDQPLNLTDLKPGDEFRLNLTTEQPGKPGDCAEIWLVESSAEPVKK